MDKLVIQIKQHRLLLNMIMRDLRNKKSNNFNVYELDYMNELMQKANNSVQLSNNEIIEHIKEYRESKNAIILNKLINNFFKLLIKLTHKYKKSGINAGDLIHYGIEGLIEAIDRSFNLTANEKFITYITIILERRMKDGVDMHTSAVDFPKNIMTQQRKIRYEARIEDNKSGDEVKNKNTVYSKLNIEDHVSLKDIFSLEQTILRDDSIEDKLDKESLQFDVFNILEVTLSPIEKDVIIHNFGLNGESVKAFDAIGELFNISSQKVRKIKNSAIIKIRSNPKSIAILKKYFN